MRARILAPSSENLEFLGQALRLGELVAMPTETVYGLAGNALDDQAILSIFKTKERPSFDPLIVHFASPQEDQPPTLKDLISADLIDEDSLSEQAKALLDTLLQSFWPGPLTLLFPKSAQVSDLVTSGLSTVAIRSPKHPLAQALIRAANRPLAAPSANRFGRISPTSTDHVLTELGTRIDWILEGGTCEIGLESTIVRLDSYLSPQSLQILRPGKITQEDLQKVLPMGFRIEASLSPNSNQTSDTPALSPGLLQSHYAPNKSLILVPHPWSVLSSHPELRKESEEHLKAAFTQHKLEKWVLLDFEQSQEMKEWLESFSCGKIQLGGYGPSVHPDEAAKHLFATLREWDESEVEGLISTPPPWTEGIGLAILDRLRKAAAPRPTSQDHNESR